MSNYTWNGQKNCGKGKLCIKKRIKSPIPGGKVTFEITDVQPGEIISFEADVYEALKDNIKSGLTICKEMSTKKIKTSKKEIGKKNES